MIPRTRATVLMGRQTISSSTTTSPLAIFQRNLFFKGLHLYLNYPRATRGVAILLLVFTLLIVLILFK
jgi:hypothetical protein